MKYYSALKRNDRHTDTCYDLDEPRKHYSKWKKPGAKLYDYFPMTCIYIYGLGQSTESRLVAMREWEGGAWNGYLMSLGCFSFWGNEKGLKLQRAGGCLHNIVNTLSATDLCSSSSSSFMLINLPSLSFSGYIARVSGTVSCCGIRIPTGGCFFYHSSFYIWFKFHSAFLCGTFIFVGPSSLSMVVFVKRHMGLSPGDWRQHNYLCCLDRNWINIHGDQSTTGFERSDVIGSRLTHFCFSIAICGLKDQQQS